MPQTRSTIFRTSALRSGLVTSEQLAAVITAVRNRWTGPATTLFDVDDETLAAELIGQGILTKYQAEQLATGRTKLDLGPYLITDFVGQGGMGQVFKAEHRMMGRVVAVKVLPKSRSTPEAIANFAREIRTQAKLDHPNLVRAYDAGRDGNVYYLVTEFVPGSDLRRLVRTGGRLSMQQAAAVIAQAALGLQHAHEGGLIHRDVKPGNILVTPEGIAKVSDLGLAGFIAEGENDPRAGKVVGTADYMSPEQIRTPREITPASDIYSLGCTLYYAVTGKVPFPGGTLSDKARRHCEEAPWHPRKFNPEVSEEFVEVLADMMEKDPADRIKTCTEVVARLDPWAAEAVPLPTQQLMRSRWMAPPLPTGQDDDGGEGDTEDTEPPRSEPHLDLRGQESGSLGSQATSPQAGASDSTYSSHPHLFGVTMTGAFGDDPDKEPMLSATLAFAVVVPIAMLSGAVLALTIQWLIGH